jgi:peroxiredoxin
MKETAVCGILAFFLSAAEPGAAQERAAKPVAVGEKVPDFTVTDLDGKTLRLSDLQKKSKTGLVTLTFWCTICTSCRGMEGRLEALHRAYPQEAGVYAIDANAGGETPAQVTAFLKQKGLTFPVVMDGAGAVANLFGVAATTTTLVIGKDGVLRYRGKFDDPKAKGTYTEDAVKAVLAGEPVAVKQTPPVG